MSANILEHNSIHTIYAMFEIFEKQLCYKSKNSYLKQCNVNNFYFFEFDLWDVKPDFVSLLSSCNLLPHNTMMSYHFIRISIEALFLKNLFWIYQFHSNEFWKWIPKNFIRYVHIFLNLKLNYWEKKFQMYQSYKFEVENNILCCGEAWVLIYIHWKTNI